MTLPKLKGYTILREVCAMKLSEIARLAASRGTAFVGIAGKIYEAKEVGE